MENQSNLNVQSLDENILFGLDRLTNIFRLFLWETGKKENLSPLQIQILHTIHKMPFKKNTVSNLTEYFELKKSTVSESITNLITKGWLYKVQDEKDKRKFYLKLTELGNTKIKSLNDRSQVILDIIQEIPIEDKNAIIRFIIHLAKRLHDGNWIQLTNICLTCKNFGKSDDAEKPYYCNFIKRKMSMEDFQIDCKSFKKKD